MNRIVGEKYGVNGQNYKISSELNLVKSTNSLEKNTALNNIKSYISNGGTFDYDLETGKLDNPKIRVTVDSKEETDPTDRRLSVISVANKYENGSYGYAFQYTGEKKVAGVKLDRKQEFALELESKMTGYRIVLSDGKVYDQWNINEKKLDRDAVSITMNDDMRYGAKVYVQYKIAVANKSKVDIKCNGFKIITGNNLEYDPSIPLLTDDTKQSSSQWKVLTKEEIRNNIIDSEKYEKYLGLEENRTIEKNQQIEYDLVLYRVIDDECVFSNVAEIVQYTNTGLAGTDDGGRRNYASSKNGISGKKSIPGNYWKGENSGFMDEIEKDTGISEALMILPPTGNNIN